MTRRAAPCSDWIGCWGCRGCHPGPHVLVDGGGRETAPPEGAPIPQVHGWRDPSGAQHRATGSTLRVSAAQDGAWTLYVRLIDDAEIEVDVSGVAAEAP